MTVVNIIKLKVVGYTGRKKKKNVKCSGSSERLQIVLFCIHQAFKYILSVRRGENKCIISILLSTRLMKLI